MYLLKLALCKTRSNARMCVSLADGPLWSKISRMLVGVALLMSYETSRVCRRLTVTDLMSPQ